MISKVLTLIEPLKIPEFPKIRCSVFLVFIEPLTHQEYIVMFLDKMNKEITNAGGTNHSDESYVKAMSRELYEESRGIFYFTPEELVSNTLFTINTTQNKARAINISSKVSSVDELLNLCTSFEHEKLYKSCYENRDFDENEKMLIYNISEFEMLITQTKTHKLWSHIVYLSKLFLGKLKNFNTSKV